MPTFLNVISMPAIFLYFLKLFLAVVCRWSKEIQLCVLILVVLPIDSRSCNVSNFVVRQSLLRRINELFWFLARFQNLVVDLVKDKTIPTLEIKNKININIIIHKKIRIIHTNGPRPKNGHYS